MATRGGGDSSFSGPTRSTEERRRRRRNSQRLAIYHTVTPRDDRPEYGVLDGGVIRRDNLECMHFYSDRICDSGGDGVASICGGMLGVMRVWGKAKLVAMGLRERW